MVAIYLTGRPQPWVGPHDIALAICRAVYANGYVKNKVMEFVGPGVASMDTDYRNGVDVMTTETTCLSSIWQTDGDTLLADVKAALTAGDTPYSVEDVSYDPDYAAMRAIVQLEVL